MKDDEIVILVPRRAHPERDKLWAYARARWEHYAPGIRIVEGHHEDGPFNRSAAVNTAARQAGDWKLGIVIDADVLCSVTNVQSALAIAEKTGRVTYAHTRWRGVSEYWTKRLLADRKDLGPDLSRDEIDLYVERTNPISWSCCVVFPRAVFDDLGGFDERFRGWGFEDMALQSAVVGLYGHERVPGDVVHLWHARTTDGNGRAAKTNGTYTADAVTNARLGRRYMVALRRDYGLHDRPGLPSDDAERERDIANLIRDDARLTPEAKRLGLPDWTDWWPTLEELRDGARAYNEAQARGSVTVIVHTGGLPERWPERREYLERSLASLTDRVTGPITQRVLYSCWGGELFGAVEEVGRRYGFYTVGPTEDVDFTAGMKAMWTYLKKRAKGEYIFQTEDDFTYDRDVDLGVLIDVLRAEPGIVQMALLRDAYYRDEQDLEAIGNILGWPRPAFTERDGWLEHRLFFTLNPSLFRRTLTNTPWPSGQHTETIFGKHVLQEPTRRSAFWGTGEQWVSHIGAVRAGAGY